jgi:succinyl-diaminopimelate desuccinylase
VDLKPVLRSSIRFLLSKESLTEEQKRATKRVFDYPTIALNVISGGVKINVVPDAAEAHFDIRLTPGVDLEKVKSHLQQLIDSSGVREVKTEFIQVSGGYYESPKSAFSRQLGKTIQKVTGAKPVYKVLTGGTDAVSLKKYQGIPCLGFGAGVEGQAHAPEEHVPIDDLVMASKVYTAFPFNYKAV